MAIQAQLFDGTTLEFPDGTDPSVIETTAKRITQERRAATAKPEEVGFFQAIPAALGRGIESLGDVATGLGIAGKKAIGDEAGIRQTMAKAKEQKPEEKPGMTVADFERIAKEQGFAAAAAQAPKYIVEQVLQSAPQMAGPLAVGAGAAALSGPLAPIVGPIAGIGTYAVQQFGNFLMRQAQEKKDPEELEITKAAITAAGTAPLGYFADRFTVGLGGVGKNAGEQVIKELAARRAAGEIGAGAVAKEVGKRAAKGATVGIIAEAPTEVLEQAAERYQAGLDLTGADAANEYKEAFFGAAAAGGGIGGTSGAARGYAGYRGELGEARAAMAPPPPPADTTGQAPPPPPPSGGERIRIVNGREESVFNQIQEIDDQISALSNQRATIQDPNSPELAAIDQELSALNASKKEIDKPAPLPKPGDTVVLNFETEAGPQQKDAVVGQQYHVNAEGARVKPNQYGRLPKGATPVVPLTFTFDGKQVTQAFSPTQLASQIAEIIKPAPTEEFVARGQMGYDFSQEPSGFTSADIEQTADTLYKQYYEQQQTPQFEAALKLKRTVIPAIKFKEQQIAELENDLIPNAVSPEQKAKRERVLAALKNELQGLQNQAAEIIKPATGQEFAARGQMGFDFSQEPSQEPKKVEVPTDQEMQDAGFTQYEIEQLKKNPWPERYQQIKQGYRMIGGQFRQVTQEDVDQVKQSNINKQQIKADKKAQLDAAFAKDPRDGVSQILGSDWNRKFNLSTEEYQKHAYDTLERQYGSIDSGVAMLERRLAAAQSTKPKQEAPGFALTSEGAVPEMEGIEEVPEGERARMMLIGAPGDPAKPVRDLFDSLKSASANPAESIKFKTEVRKFLDDVTEFIGGRMRKQVSRYQEVDSEGRPIGPPPEPPKGQDVGVRLSGPELTRRMNFLNNFFDSLSIAPKEREALTSGLSQQVANMSAKEQSEVIGALTKLKNINTRRGIEELRKLFSNAIDKFERGRIDEAEAAIPFKASEDITNLDPYVAAAVSRAIKNIDTSTPEGKAAMAYLGSETGWRYGLAMRSAAFDLAVPITDFTGVSFKGQNQEQAELFKKWVEDNLPQQEYKKFEATVKEFKETNRKADQALKNANTRKASRIDPSYLKSLYRRPTGKEEIQAFPAGMKGLYTAAGQGKKGLSNKDFGLVHDIQFAVMHPAIQERIEANDINGALRMIADQKIEYRKKTGERESSTYTQFISGLAKRLLELNLTTDVVVNQQNKLTAYYIQRNAKGQRAQFINQLSSFPWGKEFIAKHNLRGDLNDPAVVRQTLQVLEDIANNKISFGKDDVIPPIAGQFAQLLKTYRDAVANLNSQGFFFAGMNTINLNTERGGMSAATFLHEVVHAATLYSLIPANYDTLGPAQKAAVNELRELFEYAKKKYEGTAAAGAYGFENVYEFVSEALSNPDFQEFLQVLRYETPYKGGKALSLWNKFIGLVGKLFGLDNVLGKTIANANAIMRTSTKDDTAVIAYSNAGKYTMNSTMPYNSTQYMGLMNTILTGRLTWSGVKDRLRNVYVGALTLRQISDIMGDRVPKIKEFINSVENMLEYRNNILEEVKSEIKPWQEFQSESPAKAQIMSKLMIDSTVAKKDPSKRDANGNFIKTGDKLIDDAWEEIGPKGQKIYEDVKLFYKRRYDAYVDMLLENKMLALMADGFTKAEALISPEYVGLKKHFQDQSIEPYFPLRRFGEYSVRLMSGKQRSFYMFESPEQRDAFVKSVIPILEKKYGKSFDPEQDIKTSNSSREMLYSENLQNAESLSTLKDLIKTTPATDVMGLKGPDEVTLRDNLTKAIEDLYLLQIPDQSIRKMFMNRENIPGMDLDMLRAFTSSAFHMAYQHSRFKYSRPIYNSLDAATTQIGELDREEGKVLSEYMKEIRQHRINYIMNPIDTGKTAARLSNLSFLWFMTSPASAITNMLGVPAVGLPVVGAKFGNMKALATMAAYSKRVLGTGFKDKDGRFTSPSLSNKLDTLSEAQKEAYQRAVADGIIDITLSHDIVGLAETPSALYQEGAEHAVMKYASSIFHGAEKFNREVVFMSSFDLAYQQYKNKGYNEEGARKKAIEVAKELTYKSMFDYSTLNKPRFLQGPAAKVIFQFKQFSQQMTYLLTRSAFETIYKEFTPTERALIKEQIKAEDKAFRTEQPRMTDKELDDAVEKYIADFRKEARSRLLGVYGTTAVFAGASGLPLWWVVSSTANALQAVFGEDDDEDWDFDIWFKEWANETFGGFFGDVVARGAASQLTGANVADRLSLNGLWFRDMRKSEDEVSWVQNQLINLLGPTAGLVINSAEAVKQYNQGYVDRAIETASPALIKNFLKGMRFSETFGEGRATNLKGDELVGDITGAEAFYQAIGFAPERVAQQQKVNIEKKTIEQDILKRQNRLRDAFFMAIDNDDDELLDRTLEKIIKFNERYPELSVDGDDLIKSVRTRYERRALAESMGGMTYDKRLIGRLSEFGEYGN